MLFLWSGGEKVTEQQVYRTATVQTEKELAPNKSIFYYCSWRVNSITYSVLICVIMSLALEEQWRNVLAFTCSPHCLIQFFPTPSTSLTSSMVFLPVAYLDTVESNSCALKPRALCVCSLCLFVHWNEFGSGDTGRVVLRLFTVGFCTLSSLIWMSGGDWVTITSQNQHITALNIDLIVWSLPRTI